MDVITADGVARLPRGLRQAAWLGGRFAIGGLPVNERRLRHLLGRRLAGKRVLITGASRGIGRALARRIGDAGAEVLLVSRDGETLAALAAEIEAAGGRASAHPADLSSVPDSEELVGRLLDRHSRVEVLVNNAALSIRRPIASSYDRHGDCTRTMAVNYFGATRLILGLLPGMREAREGHIVNVSSIGLQTAMPRFSAYNASKAAIDAFVRSLAPEVAAEGVRVSVAYMPLVRTTMSAPTTSFSRLPALSADAAAARLCQVLVRRPPRASSPAGTLGEMATLLLASRSQHFMQVIDAALEGRV